MLKDNVYFKKMEQKLNDWVAERDEHLAKKETILKQFGRESAEYDEWQKKRDDVFGRPPITSGADRALGAWRHSGEDFNMSESLWVDEEVVGFVKTLREAGVESFVYTCHSTSAIEQMHKLVEEGCEMVGLDTAVRTYGNGTDIIDKGIRFKL